MVKIVEAFIFTSCTAQFLHMVTLVFPSFCYFLSQTTLFDVTCRFTMLMNIHPSCSRLPYRGSTFSALTYFRGFTFSGLR